MINRGFFFLFVFFFLYGSCSSSQPPAVTTPSPGLPDGPVATDRPKLPSRRVQENCKGKPVRNSRSRSTDTSSYTGPLCGDDDACAETCDDIFSGKQKERECYEYPPNNVYGIQDLLADAEEGELSDDFLLECLLDIDDAPIITAFKKLNATEAKEVLVSIADDDTFAEIFSDEDENSKILRTLLEKATRATKLVDQVKYAIEGRYGLIHLASNGGEHIWAWLDEYVAKTKSDTIEIYCEAIVGADAIDGSNDGTADDMKDDLILNLINGDNFRSNYESNVRDHAGNDNNEYNALETKDYCLSVFSS